MAYLYAAQRMMALKALFGHCNTAHSSGDAILL